MVCMHSKKMARFGVHLFSKSVLFPTLSDSRYLSSLAKIPGVIGFAWFRQHLHSVCNFYELLSHRFYQYRIR